MISWILLNCWRFCKICSGNPSSEISQPLNNRNLQFFSSFYHDFFIQGYRTCTDPWSLVPNWSKIFKFNLFLKITRAVRTFIKSKKNFSSKFKTKFFFQKNVFCFSAHTHASIFKIVAIKMMSNVFLWSKILNSWDFIFPRILVFPNYFMLSLLTISEKNFLFINNSQFFSIWKSSLFDSSRTNGRFRNKKSRFKKLFFRKYVRNSEFLIVYFSTNSCFPELFHAFCPYNFQKEFFVHKKFSIFFNFKIKFVSFLSN